MAVSEFATERLVLRQWRDDDVDDFVRMNGDPRVMGFFPEIHSRSSSKAALVRIRSNMEMRGFGEWALALREGGGFVGMVGLSEPRFSARFTPCVEILWRLQFEHWGYGYATEAAQAVLTFGFERLELHEIVAFTTVENHRSRRVMEKLGMRRHAADDFLHPSLPEDHPLRPHVLYRLPIAAWRSHSAAVSAEVISTRTVPAG